MAKSGPQPELHPARPSRRPAQDAKVAILRMAEAIRGRMAALVSPKGITFQQYNVLRILRGSHPTPLPTLEIGDRMIERTPGITRLLSRLEQKGLVRRARGSDDRRQIHCWITEAGLALLRDLDQPVAQSDERSMGGLSEDEVRRLSDLLERACADG